MFLGKRENSGNCDKNEGSGVLRKISDMRFWENKSVFGDFPPFLGTFLGTKYFQKAEVQEVSMKKKNFKGRCEKRKLSKCAEVCRTYNPIQFAYADLLERDEKVEKYRCNVLLEGLKIGEYTSDFVCTKTNGELMVRECVYRKQISKPLTVKLLDAS